MLLPLVKSAVKRQDHWKMMTTSTSRVMERVTTYETKGMMTVSANLAILLCHRARIFSRERELRLYLPRGNP